ncbi:MAG: flagellar hook-associated protein FlgL [Betaproteobacteria bacterium]|nr:flagellar hook-associated protein FlgL [Betaproteobacteria bacterium]
MRISTAQIFEGGVRGMQTNQGALYRTMNQLSTGRKVLTPADDPVASARALVVDQSRSVNQQFMQNQNYSKEQLSLTEGYMSSITDALQTVRTSLVQAGNIGALSDKDRSAIADEIEARLNQLLGIANSQNSAGDFLFSGYQGNVRPFTADASGNVIYHGDDGLRLLQVEASRQMPTNVSGADLFLSARSGNGTFVTASGGNAITAGNNTGMATIDKGSVLEPGKWQSAVNDPTLWSDPNNAGNLSIQFNVTTVGGITTTTYDIYDVSTPGAPVLLTDTPQPYTPGQSIRLEKTTPPPVDFGATVLVDGQPDDGDSFSIAPSTKTNMFDTLRNIITTLRTPSGGGDGTYNPAEYYNRISGELTNIDQHLENVERVRTGVGANLQELDALNSQGQDNDIQYQGTISSLLDIDYASAISDLMRQNTQLEAAQRSFAIISSLSLFNVI